MMSRPPLSVAVRQAGLWLLLVVITALLTLLFSILGTITVAAVTAVVLAGSRRWQWRAIPISLAFLLAGLALAHTARADLDLGRRISMTALSFGAFWVTYLLGLFLMSMEKKEDAAPGIAASTLQAASGSEKPSQAPAAQAHSSLGDERASEPLREPEAITLGHFRGTWLSETGSTDAPRRKRLMEIGEGRFALQVSNGDGSLHLLANGRVELEGEEKARTLKLRPASNGEADSMISI